MTPIPDARPDAPDAVLLHAVAAGDMAAFERLYDRHCRQVYGLAVRMAGRTGHAEDIAQEAFLTLWRTAHRYRPERGSVTAWLLTITRNLAVDHIRRRAAEERALAQAAGRADRPDPDGVADLALARAAAARLRAALPALPGEQREALTLTFLEGRSGREAAGLAGIPVGTAKSRIRLGMARLRASLAPA